jgi:uncharacterized membrane protein
LKTLRLKWIPLISFGVFLVGAFLTGVLNYLLVSPEETLDPAAPASNWAEAGANALFGAAVFGIFAIIATVLRFLGNSRFEARHGRPRWFITGTLVGEILFMALAWAVIWAAVTPKVDAGFMWISYVELTMLWLVVSCAPLILSFMRLGARES